MNAALLLHPALDLLVLNLVLTLCNVHWYQLAQIYVLLCIHYALHQQLSLVLVHGVYMYQMAHLLLYANEEAHMATHTVVVVWCVHADINIVEIR